MRMSEYFSVKSADQEVGREIVTVGYPKAECFKYFGRFSALRVVKWDKHNVVEIS